MLVERVFSAWPRNGGKANLVTMNEPPLPKISWSILNISKFGTSSSATNLTAAENKVSIST